MSRISRVEGNEISRRVLRLAEKKVFTMQKNGYGPLTIMYCLERDNKVKASLTGYENENGYVVTIS